MSNININELHPVNPVLAKEVNTPKEKGQTRVLPDGSLLYLEPLTATEVPAVRLEDIRPGLVQQAARNKSYRFPKQCGYEDTNVTAFLKKDYNYGPERENRPDRLFQIKSDGSRGEKPDGYVMDEGRVVLDAFDHGLRNFGHQLPMYVSSELEGWEIEDYLRRNWEISVYDLVARAPNGYWKKKPTPKNKKSKNSKTGKKAMEWHEGPPRVGTFSMRATRFRLLAGCLSWEKKDGTAAKNKRILDVIPDQFKDPAVNSTKGWRDLSKAEIKSVKAGALKKPQLGPKEKRAVQDSKSQAGKSQAGKSKAGKSQAGKSQATKEDPIKELIEEQNLFEDGYQFQPEDESPWIGAPNVQEDSMWPEYDPESFEGPMYTPQISYLDPQLLSYGYLPQQQVAPNAEVEFMSQGYEAAQPFIVPTMTGKRKRVQDSTIEHHEGQRPKRRARGRMD